MLLSGLQSYKARICINVLLDRRKRLGTFMKTAHKFTNAEAGWWVYRGCFLKLLYLPLNFSRIRNTIKSTKAFNIKSQLLTTAYKAMHHLAHLDLVMQVFYLFLKYTQLFLPQGQCACSSLLLLERVTFLSLRSHTLFPDHLN